MLIFFVDTISGSKFSADAFIALPWLLIVVLSVIRTLDTWCYVGTGQNGREKKSA